MNRYLVVIEETASGFSAYSPDVPGCVATGGSIEETESEMKAALEFHLEGLSDLGEQLPSPHSTATYLEPAF